MLWRASNQSLIGLALKAGIILMMTLRAHSETCEPKYDGTPTVRFSADGRTMILTQPYAFIGPNCRRWNAPTGTETDGASIPKIFWSVIGGPFEGRYRNAAIIHDRYCDTRTRKWQDTHEMFYAAMLASGVGPKTAWLMYKAVERFGPSWPEPQLNPDCLTPSGQIDFSKCTEDSAYEGTPITFPTVTGAEVSNFLDEISPEADPADIDKVRRALAHN
jgi:Protein of unknown function (DUF1353)